MSNSGVIVAPDCVTKFNELKLGKKTKYIIYKLSDDYKEIVVEETGNEPEWDTFREKLIAAKSKDKRGNEGKGARYAVYDVAFETPDGGQRNKITFIAWISDDCGVHVKMTYSSSKDALKRSFNGIAAEIQASDEDDLEWDAVLKRMAK